MIALMAVLLLGLAVKDCSAAILNPGICCDTKTVGEYSYTKVSVGTVPANCLNNCIYTRDDKPGSKYCFASGEQEVHCLDSTGAANGTVITEAAETELPPEANASNLCPKSHPKLIAQGPFGGASTATPFDDNNVANNGNITQIGFRTGDVMDQIQATYGNVQSPPHGGTGGGIQGPYDLQGHFIIKVAGLISNKVIQSLTFTNELGQENTFGSVNGGTRFEAAQSNCFLRYFSGSTTGNSVNSPNNFLNQITFNWCCPAN